VLRSFSLPPACEPSVYCAILTIFIWGSPHFEIAASELQGGQSSSSSSAAGQYGKYGSTDLHEQHAYDKLNYDYAAKSVVALAHAAGLAMAFPLSVGSAREGYDNDCMLAGCVGAYICHSCSYLQPFVNIVRSLWRRRPPTRSRRVRSDRSWT
jgi:hypothetical protein